MDPVLGGAIVAGGSSLVSGIVGGLGQAQANKRGVKLAREQMAWNESMWNKQNAYNTPEEQIARMRAAGLHPGLMYSQGNVGNAGEVKGYQLPTIQNAMAPVASGISSAGNAVFDAFVKNEQIQQMKAQTDFLKARTQKELNTTPTAQSWKEWYENLKQGQFQKNRGLQATANWFEARNQIQVPYWDAVRSKAEGQAKSAVAKAVVDDITSKWWQNKTPGGVQFGWARLNALQGLLERQTQYVLDKYKALETMTPAQFQQIMTKVALMDENIKYSQWQRSTGINGKTIVDSVISLLKIGFNRRGRRY